MDGSDPSAAAAAAAAAAGDGVVATATTPGGGDWRGQFHPMARIMIFNTMLKALKKHLPMPDPAGQIRLQNIAVAIESNSFTAASNRFNYFRNISLMMLYVESPYQNHRQPASGLHPQVNNLAHSPTSTLISQQQTQQPSTSASVQASSLSSDDQSSTGVSQTSALKNISRQSTITQMQLVAIQPDIRSGIQHNALNTVQQPMNQQERYPQPSMSHHGSLQNTQRTQQTNIPMQQQVIGQQTNLHQNQLICQQSSAVEMQQQKGPPVHSNNLLNPYQTQQMLNQQSMSLQQQHPDNAPLSVEDYLSEDLLGDSEFNWDMDNWDMDNGIFSDAERDWLDKVKNLDTLPLFSAAPGTQAVDFNEEIPLVHPKPKRGISSGIDIVMIDFAAVQPPLASDTQMEEDGLSPNARLAAMETISMVDTATNLKKRKVDGSSSSYAPVAGQITFSGVDSTIIPD